MKFFIGLLVGFVCGVVTTFLVLVGIGHVMEGVSDRGLTLFEEPKDCITKNSLKVFQVLNSNNALVMEQQKTFSDMPVEMQDMFSNITGALTNAPVMLLIGEKNEHFYDEQIIKIPVKQCARQIGVYKYQNKEDTFKTVPAVSIK